MAGARHGALDEVYVGLLAGLEHAELGVDRGVVGDHPRRPGLGAVLGAVPRGPAIALGRPVGINAAALVERGEIGEFGEFGTGAATGAGVDLVVEAAAAALAGWFGELLGVAQRGVS